MFFAYKHCYCRKTGLSVERGPDELINTLKTSNWTKLNSSKTIFDLISVDVEFPRGRLSVVCLLLLLLRVLALVALLFLPFARSKIFDGEVKNRK